MKILLTADWHLKHVHPFSKVVEGNIWDELFEAKMRVLYEIPMIAKEEAVDWVAISGDVFDNTNPPEAIKAELCKLLDTFTVPVFILNGNHETASFGNHAMMDLAQAYKNTKDRKTHVFIGKEYTDANGIGVFHVMMEGIDERYKNAVKYEDDRFSDYNTILLGDFHSFYKKTFAGKTFVYPGSPYPTRFGEENHSVCILECDSNGITSDIKQIKIPSYKFIECAPSDIKKTIGDAEREGICYVLKVRTTAKAENLNSVALKLREYKEKLSKRKSCLDFVYSIKASKVTADKDEISNRSVEDVALEYIGNNCMYPEEGKALFKELMV